MAFRKQDSTGNLYLNLDSNMATILQPRRAFTCTHKLFSFRHASTSSSTPFPTRQSIQQLRAAAKEQRESLQEQKVSSGGGPDALFKECLAQIRQRRVDLDPDVTTKPSKVIQALSESELDLTRKVFERIDPAKQVAPNLQHKSHYIDPMWDPFKQV